MKTDIHSVVEENYTSPISLEELAYLSGRSISSFKRDFQSIYNTTPARWIELLSGPKRPSELRRRMPEASERVHTLHRAWHSSTGRQNYSYSP